MDNGVGSEEPSLAKFEDLANRDLVAKDGEEDAQNKAEKKATIIRYAQAVFCVMGMIVTWVAMSELLQSLPVGHFFMTWYIHCMYMVYFIPAGILFWRRKKQADNLIAQGHVDVEPVTLKNPGYEITPKHFLILGCILSFLLFIVAWLWYVSLPLTTVAANNSIYQSISVFVFIFSVWLVREKVTIQKVFAVVISVVGLVLVAIAPERTSGGDSNPTALGYVWVIGSTVLYGLYEVLYKKYMEPEEDQEELKKSSRGTSVFSEVTIDTIEYSTTDPGSVITDDRSLNFRESKNSYSLGTENDTLMRRDSGQSITKHSNILIQAEASMCMLALIGFYTLVLMWPIFPLFNATKVEIWQWPSKEHLQILTGNAFMDGFYNVVLLYGIMLVSPLFMSVGTMLVVPVSIFVDHFVHDTKLSPEAIGGVVCIVMGFISLNFPITRTALRVVSQTIYQKK
eukprot:gb/GECG01013272.1/.p1 GENE.gb/GECG01013272.1/~~gb/GECG01013272.1/.p1  ORF type:complete len:454 (+),score=40.94 gb/GECG01013272.1/:1-1362(+)